MENKEVVKLINVSKRYYIGGSVYVDALIDVNISIKEGEIVIIMGPSGSGKTTLMNIMGTLDKPTSGRIIIDGVDVTDVDEDYLSRFRLEKLGFVFQQYNLVSQLTALENVMLPMLLTGKYTKDEAREKARLLLDLVGVAEFMNNKPSQLSGGQQQRVAIARALANDPSFIIMDEPTGSIDLASSFLILDLIRLLNKTIGVTFVIATHNMEVASIGSRIIYLRGGRVMQESDLARIKEEFSKLRVDRSAVIKSYLRILDIEEQRIMRLGEDISEIERKRKIMNDVIGDKD
ncbi:ABC transporter ATP-binding protein [Vulcanisaeta souniana]|uniref:Macrolide ABC transporter ATP-binding protein n=1 Tax=Vulcanisaeta souniana JCM 11219 TaxID=1293586 RepID=A0A830E4Y7_9CREN|nr:ABC transporter ATP-binding protein [Vulcanisaeta souniana]BDR92578.1 macrolide ABC transporter ATP-binding protein [Vulcanisaeta souniana JCM 11219]GGI82815.1 macrolide ABC transporter ATP-binding protein [Vulcanisaeta souniana JCM 11219]